MRKRRVIGFFVLLLIFALVLAIIELVRFGGFNGIVQINQSNDSNDYAPSIDFTLVGFFLFVFIFILIAGLIIKFLQNYHDRRGSDNGGYRHRKLIPIDLD